MVWNFWAISFLSFSTFYEVPYVLLILLNCSFKKLLDPDPQWEGQLDPPKMNADPRPWSNVISKQIFVFSFLGVKSATFLGRQQWCEHRAELQRCRCGTRTGGRCSPETCRYGVESWEKELLYFNFAITENINRDPTQSPWQPYRYQYLKKNPQKKLGPTTTRILRIDT